MSTEVCGWKFVDGSLWTKVCGRKFEDGSESALTTPPRFGLIKAEIRDWDWHHGGVDVYHRAPSTSVKQSLFFFF